MTDIAITELTADEARELTAEIQGDLDGFLPSFLPKVMRAFLGRADKVLGFESWDAYRAEALRGLKIPVGDRPAMTAELRGAGMSTRAIGSALGVDDRTVRRDLAASGAAHAAPVKVTGLDGKRYVPPPPRSEVPDADLAEFPELEHYADRPAKAAALAEQLRTFDPAEQTTRRATLAKVIQAEKDGRLAPKSDPSAEALAQADRLFVAANEAAQVAEKVGGIEAIEAAITFADPAQIELWRAQFTDLAATLVRLASACRPQLRRVQ